jgi:hypothetical protein
VISLLVDQNFNEHIVDGLTRRDAKLELIHLRDIGQAAADDALVLELAALQGRVLLTHDRRTIPPLAQARVAAGLAMPGVFVVSQAMPIGQAIDELLIATHCLSPNECDRMVIYFPL